MRARHRNVIAEQQRLGVEAGDVAASAAMHLDKAFVGSKAAIGDRTGGDVGGSRHTGRVAILRLGTQQEHYLQRQNNLPFG